MILSKVICTHPKQIGPVKNNLYTTKMIWTVQNHFGPIEEQDKTLLPQICVLNQAEIIITIV